MVAGRGSVVAITFDRRVSYTEPGIAVSVKPPVMVSRLLSTASLDVVINGVIDKSSLAYLKPCFSCLDSAIKDMKPVRQAALYCKAQLLEDPLSMIANLSKREMMARQYNSLRTGQVAPYSHFPVGWHQSALHVQEVAVFHSGGLKEMVERDGMT